MKIKNHPLRKSRLLYNQTWYVKEKEIVALVSALFGLRWSYGCWCIRKGKHDPHERACVKATAVFEKFRYIVEQPNQPRESVNE